MDHSVWPHAATEGKITSHPVLLPLTWNGFSMINWAQELDVFMG